MRLPWKRRQQAPRPNYTAIAVLEYDLFGIQPAPGTAAAAIIGMRGFGTGMAHQRPEAALSPVYVQQEFGSGIVSRPSPFLLTAGEKIVAIGVTAARIAAGATPPPPRRMWRHRGN